ncbi:MAG: 2-C-methyl-D-erythritol 2,4-cyclodiphosphate synthase [Spirochaetaceae bacterium]|nr:2-C-methyl-D-erythritol 2,4-cyclodiphosphate synthase [Spirochaetaceae bacterium]
MIRIGLGYDLHRLVSDRPLILGNIRIESDLGEDGHSDGDVLLHAITDALLGASGLGDIGSYFPPSDDQWKNADSGKLLQICWKDIRSQGWKLENLDCVIALEKPKFLPYRQQVIQRIANLLDCSPDCIFVKAKTGEKIGEIGKREAIAVWATCLLSR